MEAATSPNDAWLASDEFLGPGNRNIFDFTLTFENSILSILPVACLLLIFPFHAWRYSQAPKVASVGRLYWARLATAVAMVVLEVSRSVVWCQSRYPDPALPLLSGTTITSAILGPVGAVIFLIMMHIEYFHAIYSSSVIGMALSLMVLLDSARTRGFWIRPAFAPVGQLSLVIVILEIIFLLLQDIPKTLNRDVADGGEFFPEAKAGFWNRMLMLWVNTLLMLGYRTKLTLQNLGILGPAFSTEALMVRFELVWAKTNRNAPHALVWTCLRTFIWPFLAGVIPRCLYSLTNFTMPLAVQQILIYMDEKDADPAYPAGLIGAITIGYIVNGLSYGMVSYYMNRLATYLRGALIAVVFQKNLRLGLSEARAAASVGIMTADIEGIVQDVERLHDMTLMIPEVAVSLYLFWTVIGKSFFITTLVLLAGAVWSWYVGNKNGPAFAQWNAGIQDRVSETLVMISHMKGIRMIGLDRVIARRMRSLREREVDLSRSARILKVIMGMARALEEWLGYIVTLLGGLYWTIWKDGLDPVTVWPAIAYMRVLAWPFMALFTLYPLVTSLASRFMRIQNFLNLPEAEDDREILECIPNSTQGTVVKFDGVCVSARDQSHAVLEDVQLEIGTAVLSMVVGSVGSGKTVLLKTILGEAQPSQGTVQLTTAKIAFCDQAAWLPDISIRDAVIGDSPVDEDRYAEVINACALAYDIQQLPKGDSTYVGPNGANMSGGQKQRIALARAVYSLMPLVVCDDILSALDAETAKAIFTNVFSSVGILKRQGRTAILATHSGKLQWLTSADQVIVVKEGKVGILDDAEEIAKYAETAEISAHESYAAEEPEVIVDDNKAELAFATAVQDTRSTDTGLYRFTFQAVANWKTILFLCFTLMIALTESFQEIYIRIWLQDAPSNKLYILGMVAILCYAVISDGITYWVYQMVIMPTISISMHTVFVEKVMSATLPFILSTSSGVLLNRFSQDMTLIGQQLPMVLFQTLYTGGVSVINLVVVASSASWSALCIPVVLVLLWAIQHFYLKTSRQVRLLDLEVKTPLYAKLNEMLSGVEHIRSFGWQSQTLKQSLQLIDNSQTPFYYMFTIQRWLYIILTLTGSGMSIMIGTLALYLRSSTSQASAGLGLINNLHFTVSWALFIQRWTKLETTLGAITRLKSFVQETPSESDDGCSAQPPNWPAHGAIVFKDVSARYSSEPGTEAVIKNISLQVDAGQKVVIVGRTGSGKSTMILTLLNFLDMTGSIMIDGVDISTIPRHQLRTRLTTLPQDSIEILGSVRDNLLPFDQDDEAESSEDGQDTEKTTSKNDRTAELETVLAKVHLLDVITKRGGLDVAAKDLHLSSGQHQLFNLARAILHKHDTGSKIVLMDEVTSSMDFETDRIIQTLLDSEFGDCTRVIISHRATSHVNCDKLVTMQDGKILSVQVMKKAETIVHMAEKSEV